MQIELIEELKLAGADRDQIEEMNREVFPENLNDGRYLFNKKQSNPKRMLIKQGKLIIGHLLSVERFVRIGDWSANLLYVGEVMVKEQFRNRGLGKLLITEFIKHVKDDGFDGAILICEKEVEPFYKKCGLLNLEKTTVFLGGNNQKSRTAIGCIMGISFKSNLRNMDIRKMEFYLGDSV